MNSNTTINSSIPTQGKQQLYPVEYVHYLEQSVMDLTERIIALEEELKVVKQVGISTMINDEFEKPQKK